MTKIDLREGGLYGELYMPKSDKPRAGDHRARRVEGGLQTISNVGVAFSSRDTPLLALAYFQEEGLPKTLENVPLEYFDKALDWLKEAEGRRCREDRRDRRIRVARRRRCCWPRAGRTSKATVAFAPSGYVWQGLNMTQPDEHRPGVDVRRQAPAPSLRRTERPIVPTT